MCVPNVLVDHKHIRICIYLTGDGTNDAPALHQVCELLICIIIYQVVKQFSGRVKNHHPVLLTQFCIYRPILVSRWAFRELKLPRRVLILLSLDDNFASLVNVCTLHSCIILLLWQLWYCINFVALGCQMGPFSLCNSQKFIQFQLTVNVAVLIINFVSGISSGDVPLNAFQVWIPNYMPANF